MMGIITALVSLTGWVQYLDASFTKWYYTEIQKLAEPEVMKVMQDIGKAGQIEGSLWGKFAMYAFFIFFTIAVISLVAARMTKGSKNEYVDDKGVEHAGVALPQTEEEPVNEEKPGLWANIRAKRARGEAPAHKNSQAHKDAVKAGKEINKNEEVDDEEKSPEEVLNGLTEMAMGDLERIEDYAEMISDRMKEGQELSSWMYSQITLAVDQLNSVHDAMDGKDGVKESVTEALVKGKTYGGSKCEGGCFVGKNGLMKIIKISKDSPKDVFMFRDDNYSGLQPHFIKNGVIAKATVINPAYDLEKHKVRNLKIGNDVILSVRLFVSTNESVTECKTCNSK
jgi:hypothetical protein